MAYVTLALLVAVVSVLAWLSTTTGRRPQGCCAPANPLEDLRMREAIIAEEGTATGSTTKPSV